jgi:2-keto-3-deoxy-L-rhamnonate aldolase RhmA
MKESLRIRLRKDDPLIGAIVSLPSPEIAELLITAGYEWLCIDMEHSALSLGESQRILQAIAGMAYGVVRCPANDEVWIKRCLDLGADGLIIPQVNDRSQAEAAIRWAKFPSEGTRSVGIGRAHGYGLTFAEYVARANQDTAMILQAEHADAVKNIDDILKVHGLDCILLGPYDLSASLGKIGQVDDPAVQGAIDSVIQACRRSDMPVGAFGVSAEAMVAFREKGIKLLVAGADVTLLADGAKGMLGHLL